MRWQVGLAKHIGGRGEQQDHVGACVGGTEEFAMVVLADGMGGHRGGALASRLVVEVAQQCWAVWVEQGRWAPYDMLGEIANQAHERICREGRKHGLEPHSTCVLGVLEPGRATWLHIGDSRCYVVRKSGAVHRTRDHSVVQLLVDMKEVNEEQMGAHPDQNKLLRSLGGSVPPQPELDSAPLGPGDGLVLCSDGLWETVTAEEMAAAVRAKDLPAAADGLVELAAKRGGKEGDNVSVVLARLSASSGNGGAAASNGSNAGGRWSTVFKQIFR